MRKWSVVVSVVLLGSAICLLCSPIIHAQGPAIDRCVEYLYPYTPIEWERCVGDEFNKFPAESSELRDAYIHAPVTGQWPAPQVIEPGDDAPLLSLPEIDLNGQVYVAPPDSKAYDAPLVGSGAPDMDYWWQHPASQRPQSPQIDEYTLWQNYWLSGGVTPGGGWGSLQVYNVPGR